MNIRTKFAQVCRKMLTPLRRYFITKRIKSRVKDKLFVNKLITAKAKCELSFMYPAKDNVRKFGVVLVIYTGGNIQSGVILRCGCYSVGYGARLSTMLLQHEDVVDHGRLLR